MPEPIISSSVTASALKTAIESGYGMLMKAAAERIVKSASEAAGAIFRQRWSDLDPYTEATFERCSKIKTILNRHEPVSLTSIYINPNFKCGNKIFDAFEFVEEIRNLNRLIVTGTGGIGKTLFLKYLWLCLFNTGSRFPIFIELRRLNELTSENLLVYIYKSIIDTSSTITETHFKDALREGLFTIILDGFDELDANTKLSVEKQLLEVSHNNPRAQIIVSSRPDNKFLAWQTFTEYKIQPLSKTQVIELIDQIDYERRIKKKFLVALKQHLYDKHVSFLSNPLLATIMLLTFDQFGGIPERIYLFYDQAFDTLFLKHDATKEGFQRKKHTNLTIDLFKKYMSYLCIFTYFDEKFSFDEELLKHYVRYALSMHDSGLDPALFIQDLIESVCMFQYEGSTLLFTHRSFQEYFSAYCLSNFINENFYEITMKLCRRQHDTALPMLMEMNRERNEQGKVRRIFCGTVNLQNIADT